METKNNIFEKYLKYQGLTLIYDFFTYRNNFLFNLSATLWYAVSNANHKCNSNIKRHKYGNPRLFFR